ncbi:ABC transporter substrate-binding protein [Acuticoccus sp.]|uniref:ABC transporter substrate-binding protein n=1 Tax=Acuticoccus sp. TaxID=1904378 RepID=UPI003B51EE3A
MVNNARLSAALLAAAGMSTLLAGAPAMAQDDTVSIGFTTALTGPFNEFGEGYRRGVEIAVEEWNEKGGVNGVPVEIGIALDDQLVPDRAVQNMRRVLDDANIELLIAPSGSGPTLAVVDMLQADGRPVCNTQAQTPSIVYPEGDDGAPRPNIFSITISNTIEAQKLATVLADEYDSVAILHESTGYGVTGAELVEEELQKLNPNIKINVESFNQRSQDFTAQLARSQRSGAGVLLVIGLGADLAVIRKNMARLNINLPLYATAGGVTPPYIEGAGDLVVGTRAASVRALGEESLPEATQGFAERYKEKYGIDRWWGDNPDRPQIAMASTVMSGYDCANLLFDAVRRAGTTEPEAVVAAMNETESWPGASIRSISFTADDHTAMEVDDLFIYEMQKDGDQIVFVPVSE